MVEDERGSRKPRGSVVTIATGSGSVITAINLREQESLSLDQLRMQYSGDGGVEVLVEVYDEPDGTPSGSLNDKVDEYRLSPGEDANPDMVWEDIEDDLLLMPDGSSDAPITVTVGGYTISG